MSKRLKDMTVDELKARLAEIEDLNPHSYLQLQSYRLALSALALRKEGR